MTRRRYLFLVGAVMVSGFALFQDPQLQIQGGGFLNETGSAIKNAEMKVLTTSEVAACSYISPGGFFGNSSTLPGSSY